MLIFYRIFCKSTLETDQTSHPTGSGLAQHCLHLSPKTDAILIWDKHQLIGLNCFTTSDCSDL